MYLFQVVKLVTWHQVSQELHKFFPSLTKVQMDKFATKFNIFSCESVIDTYQEIEFERESADYPPKVWATTDDNTLSSLAGYTFGEWLGMSVATDVIKQYTSAQIVAMCLWEATFYSRGHFDRLIDEV